MIKVFIDGSSGTTGLKIFHRLADRSDVELIEIDVEKRKDINQRVKCIKESDYAILCLPDAASREIIERTKDVDTIILDASTAHRTNPD